MKKKIIIFGGNGNIGRHIVQQCNYATYDIIAPSSKDCDLLDIESVRQFLSGISQQDNIIMSAGITRLKDNSYHAMMQNISMVANLCEVIATKTFNQLIFFSSCDVYGIVDSKIVISEQTPVDPQDYYSLSKLVCEKIFRIKLINPEFSVMILRIPGVYGYLDKGSSTVGYMVSSAIQGRIIIHGDGLIKRDFINANDLSALCAYIINNPKSGLVNVATGQSTIINEIAHKIKKIINPACKIIYRTGRNSTEMRSRDIIFDVYKFQSSFPGFKFREFEICLKDYIINTPVS